MQSELDKVDPTTRERFAKLARQGVADWPAPTSEQRSRLAVLLHPPADASDTCEQAGLAERQTSSR